MTYIEHLTKKIESIMVGKFENFSIKYDDEDYLNLHIYWISIQGFKPFRICFPIAFCQVDLLYSIDNNNCDFDLLSHINYCLDRQK